MVKMEMLLSLRRNKNRVGRQQQHQEIVSVSETRNGG
jgi:hypothetical protein